MAAAKKALIIAYYWPPSGGSGVQRWMYFARYLEEFGIEPVVITVDPEEAAYQATDETHMAKVAHVRTYHTGAGFQLIKLYASLKKGKTKNTIPIGDFGNPRKNLFDKIAGYVRGNFFIPDARVGWTKKVIPLAEKLLAQEQFDFLVTTGPPHSTHLVGLQLKKKHALHWIADFRDPWREIYYADLFHRSKRADRKDAELEQQVLRTADTILTVGPSMRELLAKKTPDNDKVRFIHNGYDSELFEGIRRQSYQEFTITHIGVWTGRQPFAEIAEAVSNVLSARPELTLRFVIVGGTVSPDFISGLSAIPRLIVDFKGKTSHREALQEMVNADLLLNCLPFMKTESKIMISGKLMEYIATGNPIIAIGDLEGDAATLLSQFPEARMFPPGDSHSIEKRILELLSAERQAPAERQALLQYSRRETARQLAELLKSLPHV
jgi:glycosyltransferase involved in cell wall biosynthesis